MTLRRFLLPLALLCAGASAQVYKWKDAKGVTHFSDNPPASALNKSEVKTSPGADANPALPYELAQAARKDFDHAIFETCGG